MDNDKGNLYNHWRFIFLSLDPIYIGTGGYRLGRVDNAIVREPGTNLPKIPGTSLMGATRSYAAMRYGKLEAAGSQRNYKGNKDKCPIIYTFGTATGTGQAGKISMGDAQILFFPVYSLNGPVWVSTKEILACSGFKLDNIINKDDKNIDDEIAYTSWGKDGEAINLGWLLLKRKTGLNIIPQSNILNKPEWKVISDRIVLVSKNIFSQIVNSNLEVRTSVAINPETGAAEEGALFTYEALPRATWLWCDIIEDDYTGRFPVTDKQFDGKADNNGNSLGEEWKSPLNVVKAGLKLIEYLGIGGMCKRGFGRMKLVSEWEVGEDES